ncbi:hypothetical protein FRC12_016518 [Ceratobasidium sp. 428]|nr:hypothetical protein FRC12_016518 [Ceratobasidium sp. 428]
MNPDAEHSDTPASESGKTGGQNEDYRGAETPISSPQSPEAILYTHEPDDAPPLPGDKAQARGRVKHGAVTGGSLQRSETLNGPTEVHNRGSNGPVAQGVPAGGRRDILPEPRVVTPPPPPVAPANEQ